jgi:hypothetical protein
MEMLQHVEVPVSRRRLQGPAWSLALSPVLFLAWVVGVIATMSGSGVSQAADLTRAQLDSIRVGWLVTWPLYAVAVIFGAVALVTVTRVLRRSVLTVGSQVAAVVAVVAVLGCVVLREVALGFSQPRLGDNGAYVASQPLSYAAIWALVVATVLTGLALRAAGVLRRTGLIVAIVAALLLVLDLVTLALPPWFAAFYLLAFGVGLLRGRVPSQA